MHLIPWLLLEPAIAPAGHEDDPRATVTMSRAVFRLLIEAALFGQPYDEQAYLASNPDVAQSVRDGSCPSGRAHFVSSGYFEGRPTGPHGFDEAWYLARYLDVKTALLLGQSTSGKAHFDGPGVREWRSPNGTAEPDVARWREAIAGLSMTAREQGGRIALSTPGPVAKVREETKQPRVVRRIKQLS